MSEVPVEFTMSDDMKGEALSPDEIEGLARGMEDDTAPEYKDEQSG